MRTSRSIAASAPRTSASLTSPIVPKRTIFPRKLALTARKHDAVL